MNTIDVRKRREELGVSRAMLASMSGLSPAKIFRIEQGKPKGDELERVQKALDEYAKEQAYHEQGITARQRAGGKRMAASLVETLNIVLDRMREAHEAPTIKAARSVLDDAIAEAESAVASVTGEAKSETNEPATEAGGGGNGGNTEEMTTTQRTTFRVPEVKFTYTDLGRC